MSRRGVLARLDDAVLPSLRRVAERVVAPVRWVRSWEASTDRGRLVRAVVRRPVRVATAAGLVVVLAAMVHLERFPELAEQRQPTASDAAAAADEVGPRVGADLDAYVQGRDELLDGFADHTSVRAIVSFRSTVPLDRLPLSAALEVEAVQLVVPAQERDPRQLDLRAVDDPEGVLERLLASERADLDQEIDELASTLEEDLGDPAFEEDFERRLEELEAAREELADDVGLVFAAIVVGRADQLRDLRADDEIRAVDPAGPADRTTQARFHGILPSDTDRATTGRPL